MPYNSNRPTKHGSAEYNSYMQLVSGDFDDIPQGDDTLDGRNEYFARLVYQVNSSTSSLSGAFGIDDSGTVGVSGENLMVIDLEANSTLDEILVKLDNVNQEEYVSILVTEGNYDYIMHAEPGAVATSGDTGWQCRRIYDDGSIMHEMFPDGDTSFNYIAADYATFNYTF